MKKCTACGEFNNQDAKFCSNCGQTDFDTSGTIVCANCKELVSAGSPYCVSCGAKLVEYTPVAPVTVPEPTYVTPEDKNKPSELVNLGLVPASEQPVVAETEKVPVYEEKLTCPTCGEPLRSSDVFCTRCGADIAETNTGIVVKRKVCPHCHRANAFSAKHCSYCFTSLSNVDYEDFMLTYVSNEDGKFRQAVLQSSTNKKLKVCPECGSLCDLESKQCVKCGTSLVISDEKKICFICGAENEYDAEFCNKCRYPLSGKKLGKEPQKVRCSCGELNDSINVFCTRCGNSLSK